MEGRRIGKNEGMQFGRIKDSNLNSIKYSAQAGGNKKFKDFLQSHQDLWDDSMTIQQKYISTAAALYGEKVASKFF